MLIRSTNYSAMLRFRALPKRNKGLNRHAVSLRPVCTAINFGVILFSLILTGCVTKNGQSPLETLAQVVVPEVKVTDYRYTSCDAIWGNEQPNSRDNALFWLRMMDCADRVDTSKARTDASQIEVDNWSSAFQQNILLNSADPSISERRKMLDSINTYSLSFPTAVRPLLQLWREQQVQIINLADANARYKRLQQETDTKFDRLKEENAKLSFELDATSRKLENLTDIERQLSSRKKSTNETEKEVENSVDGEKPAEVTSEQTEPNKVEKEPNDKP